MHIHAHVQHIPAHMCICMHIWKHAHVQHIPAQRHACMLMCICMHIWKQAHAAHAYACMHMHVHSTRLSSELWSSYAARAKTQLE